MLSIDGKWNVDIDESVQPEIENLILIPDILTNGTLYHNLTLWEEWNEMPDKFSGLLDYTKTIELQEFEGELLLDLGKVYHCAEVWVNGERPGAKLWPPYQFTTNLFKPGKNEIKIRVGNLVNNNYEMDSPSGLLGPVTIKKDD